MNIVFHAENLSIESRKRTVLRTKSWDGWSVRRLSRNEEMKDVRFIRRQCGQRKKEGKFQEQ